METEARREVLADGVSEANLQPPARSLDLRYRGVESTINVPWPADGDFAARYGQLHEQLYGYRREGRALEIVAARVEVVGTLPEPPDPAVEPVLRRPVPSTTTETWFDGKPHATPVFFREEIRPGDEFDGPAIVCEPTSTVVVDPGFRATILSRGELLLVDQAESQNERRHDRSRSGPARDLQQPLRLDRRADGRHAAADGHLHERERAARFQLCPLHGRRRSGRQRAAHPRPPGRDGRNGQTHPGRQSRPGTRRRVCHQRSVPRRFAPARRHRCDARAPRRDGPAALRHGQPCPSRRDRRHRAGQHAPLLQVLGRRGGPDQQFQAGREGPLPRGRTATAVALRAVSDAQCGRQPGRHRRPGRGQRTGRPAAPRIGRALFAPGRDRLHGPYSASRRAKDAVGPGRYSRTAPIRAPTTWTTARQLPFRSTKKGTRPRSTSPARGRSSPRTSTPTGPS